jgi:hypothetical protein
MSQPYPLPAPMPYPNALPYARIVGLTDDESAQFAVLATTIAAKAGVNLTRRKLYDAKYRVNDLQISIPPQLRRLAMVVGWPGMVVDVLEERLDWDGFAVPGASDDLGVGEIVAANQLDLDASLGHLGALIYGVAFVAVGTGTEGEPEQLITVESPMSTTVAYDARRRRGTAGLTLAWDQASFSVTAASLYLLNETIRLERSSGGLFRVVDRDQHNLDRLALVRFANRPDVGSTDGRSEMTPAVVAHAESAVRTLLGAEVSREFYSSPQRYLLGADESAFTDADGNRKTGWETVLGRVWAIDSDENGTVPQVGQFTASSPAPYLELLRGYAQLLAAEAGMPSSYLGFVSDNPSSADAIRAGEARLVKRAERRQRVFGASWSEVMRLALLMRDKELPPVAPVPLWRDASTPTRAAAADEAVKLVAAGILPADSEVTLERLGFSEVDRDRIQADRRRSAGRGVLAGLTAAVGAPDEGLELDGDSADPVAD